MSPVGWDALGQWGEDVARIEPLAGGVANDVWRVRVHGHLAVWLFAGSGPMAILGVVISQVLQNQLSNAASSTSRPRRR